MIDFEPILGSEEYGAFPVVESLPPNNWKLLQKQITDQAYEKTVDRYNDSERMMSETAHSEVEKHATLADHFKKDKLARVLAGGGLVLSGLALGIGVSNFRSETPTPFKVEEERKLQSQISQDTVRIAKLEDQLSQLKKSPTLVQEAYSSCIRYNAQFYPQDTVANCQSLKP